MTTCGFWFHKVKLQKDENFSKVLVVGHVAGSSTELRIGFNDFVHCF